MAIDHLVLKVPTDKYEELVKFYTAILAPLNYELRHSVGGVVTGFGEKTAPTGAADIWLASTDTPIDMHVALRAESRAAVDTFHAGAVAAGGVDNGAPGLRPQYHPDYYAGYITDPAGNNIEAVYHHPA
ncbi:hypothetical protein NQ176_g4146 [Zarea fungicola]|uniref:Uncharacterized protein n=1 Tax=Zarea fungicola TaxID=93591 RepID=A0ACC1NGW6_9HYPO|nr:hypothetical protein NQ176_g4146 [Lecanicillium fungicola]